MKTDKKCEPCQHRLECFLTEDECLLLPSGLTTDDNIQFIVQEELKGRMIAWEHYGCPKQPAEDELAMYRLVDRSGELFHLKCEYCGNQILMFVSEREI